MRHWKIWLYLVAMLAILAGCLFVSLPGGFSGSPEPTVVKVAATTGATAELPAPAAEVTLEPVAEETEETKAPAESPEAAEVAAVDYCLACHTDKDQLVLTGKPEEEKPKESEGAG